MALRPSTIRDPSGNVVFSLEEIRAPQAWSDAAVDVLAHRYLRKTGVPQLDEKGRPVEDSDGRPVLGPERDACQVFDRLAGCWTDWGQQHGYFDSDEDAAAFSDEVRFMLAAQIAAPNSPQWFNTGLHRSYGISGPAQGHWYVDPVSGETCQAETAYERPQPHACFIQSIADDLVNDGGIMDLWRREVRLFKYGSGSGTNFSRLRGAGEPLSGGGHSSGLMSFLKVGDRAATAIRVGGTTRPAAKMVCLDLDHPDIEEFICWKVSEERKVAAMVAGSRVAHQALQEVMDSCYAADSSGKEAADTDPASNRQLASAIRAARRAGVPDGAVTRVLELAGQGVTEYCFEEYTTQWDGEAFRTVSGQRSHNSVRIPNAFFKALDADREWYLTRRTDGKKAGEVSATALWAQIARCSWECGDPGIQYDTTINQWHTCPSGGRINASNPCSEYVFLDDTACTLASLNLVRFLGDDGRFDIEGFTHAIRLWTLVLEISVLMAAYPSRRIAELSTRYRTLGLGFANLGSLLMRLGLSYDSSHGRAICGAISALMTATAYATSAEMAAELGPFAGFTADRESMLRVLRNHRRAAWGAAPEEYEGLTIAPRGLDPATTPPDLLEAARSAWDRALEQGAEHGFRNAQVTVIAPTGTIGLVMDCDTAGIEPGSALVKLRHLSSGGFVRLVNKAVPVALARLGYDTADIEAIVEHAVGRSTLQGCPTLSHQALRDKGLDENDLVCIESRLASCFEVRDAFSPHALPVETLVRAGLVAEDPTPDELDSIDVLTALGFKPEQIAVADSWVYGAMTLEGAPHLKPEHLAVFDCASRCGAGSRRAIRAQAHILMMAAAQPFISGAISKTVTLPTDATIVEIQQVLRLAWERMLKTVSISRDGSRLSQPLAVALDSDAQTGLASALSSRDPLQLGAALAERVLIRYQARRRRLPQRRGGYTQKASVGGHKVYLRTGEYEEGTIGEIFIDMHREGAAFRSLMNCFAIAVSLGLQYGVPLEEFVEAFVFTRFEPNGIVGGNDRIKMATSVIDYLFREMAITYLGRTDLAQVHPDDIRPDAVGHSAGQDGARPTTEVAEVRPIASGRGRDAFRRPEIRATPLRQPTSRPASTRARADGSGRRWLTAAQTARYMGYEGDPCPDCGALTLVRNGTCLKCDTCGATTGCS